VVSLTYGVLGKSVDLRFPLVIVSGFEGVIQVSYVGEHLIQVVLWTD
jgi:hypothetical protein